ncbi:hypothetical protein FQN55_001765 [Onygenales sp. PD_40]|nr:hypothetical protein FQN55_001765 [Onygenales sp. PD_40]
MRLPRLILLLACFIFLPILLTTLSLLSAHTHRATTSQSPVSGGGVGRLKALFSFHAPSSLFPPSAMISLTDDNSTFFLARPAAFGPVLPSHGLSGQLWIGSGFGDDALRKGGISTGAEGELGCSDVPGWEDSDKSQNKEAGTGRGNDKLPAGIKSKAASDPHVEALHRRGDEHLDTPRVGGKGNTPSEDDGTDDHLHHPLPESPDFPNTDRPSDRAKQQAHADIQSLQESAEIKGKVVLLSRGGCGFLEKVKWAQRRGGVALIVGDDTRGGGLVTMYARGDTSNVTIPALFTSHTTAHLLSSLIPPESALEPGSPDDASKITLGDKSDKNSKKGKSATTTKAASKPTATASVKSGDRTNKGFFHSLFSLIGIWRDNAYTWHLQEDSRRPPSSGNIDWVMLDEFDDETPANPKKPVQANKKESGPGALPTPPNSESHQGSNDDFVIGVQDWRDPDLVPAGKIDNPAKPASTPSPAGSKPQDDSPGHGDSNFGSGGGLKGGSITPGSGEYASQDKSNKGYSISDSSSSQSANSKQDSHWWSGSFGWGGGRDGDELSHVPETKSSAPDDKKTKEPPAPAQKASSKEDGKRPDHEGLWVTLTPTSMSTSPFFDTLLVLVVSPLITLTVVYALLLLRSRIRRRRWRAPKAVVDRLPVRTYHTMTTRSSSSNSPQNAPSPESTSPTSPLLSQSRPRSPRPRQRSQTTSGVVATSSHDNVNDQQSNNGEKSSGSTLWRRRYTGRQVECVVCLEEYIDGQSRVMSLPCGHEFHAECITPWLTTRRRTCPICKGDVVRSMGQRSSSAHRAERPERMSDDIQARIAETRNDSPSAAAPLPDTPDELDSDLERGDSSTSLLNSSESSSSQSNWRNLASLSLSALSGDSMWHQSRPTRSDRNR